MTTPGTDDPMERIHAVFQEPYPSLPIPPGTWERIETEARRRRRTHRLRLSGAVAAGLLVLGGGAAALLPGTPAAQPGGPGPSSSAPTPSGTGSTAPEPSTSPSPSPSGTRTAEPTTRADGLPIGGPVPKGFDPVSLSGAPGGFLYALGDVPGCSNPVCTSMARSEDGGKSWTGIPAPVAEVGGDNPDAVREIRFATAKDGFAYGPTLFETHDGGATWTRRSLTEQVLDLAVAGDRIWLVLADCSGGTGCAAPRLMSAPVSGGEPAFEPAVRIPGPVTLARLADGGGSLTLRTDGPDGTGQWVRQRGSGWRAVTGPCSVVTDFPLQLTGLTPAADGSGELVAACTGVADPNGEPVVVVTTSQDGGRTWTAGGLQPVPSGELLLAAADRDRFVLALQPPGSAPALLVSRDAGRTWAAATGALPVKVGVRWVGAGGGGQVYALGDGDAVLYRSGSGTAFSARPVR